MTILPRIALPFFVLSILTGCQDPTPQAADVRTIVDALALNAKPVAWVDSLFGAPDDTSAVRGLKAIMPGQYRTYDVEQARVTVRFYRGSASQLMLEYPTTFGSLREALGVVGLSEAMLEKVWEQGDAPLWHAPQHSLRRVVALPKKEKGWGPIGVWYEGFPDEK